MFGETQATESVVATPEWQAIVEQLLHWVGGDAYWEGRLRDLEICGLGLHLAVMVEPYLGLVLDGRKTVESRFSSRRCPPYQRVGRGDILLLKRAGGPVCGVCEVSDVWSYRLDPQSWHEIRGEFSHALCANDPEFWRVRQSANFATLMRIVHVRKVRPTPVPKRDRRPWVVLRVSGEITGVR